MERHAIFPLAIGTYGLGAARIESLDPIVDARPGSTGHMAALVAAHAAGMNLLEASYIYAGGATMRFLADFIRRVPRESLIITVKIERRVRTSADVARQLDAYLSLLGIDYADALLLHMPSATDLPLLETYSLIADEVAAGKARHISASNLGLSDLKSLYDHFPLFSFEGLYNLECKMCEDAGILELCARNGTAYLAYKPLRLNRTAARKYPLLIELSKKYGCTQNQVLLAWLIYGKGVVPLVKASSIDHVRENLHALDVRLEADDIGRLNAFRSLEFDQIEIDWSDSGGTPIYRVASAIA